MGERPQIHVEPRNVPIAVSRLGDDGSRVNVEHVGRAHGRQAIDVSGCRGSGNFNQCRLTGVGGQAILVVVLQYAGQLP